MPYILNKTNGTIVATVQDASLDQSTDLIFVGRNYAGYGEWQNENFLKLLENFANVIPPERPIDGQIWYDVSNRKLNIWDSTNWKGIANLDVNQTNPVNTKGYQAGDLWYDSREQQLNAFNGESFVLIGPPSGADTRAAWRGDVEYGSEDPGTPIYNIKSIVGSNNEIIAIVSAEEFTVSNESTIPAPTYPLYTSDSETKIAKGITLYGADPVTGVSDTAGIYFWGTAKHASYASTASSAIGLATAQTPSTGIYRIPYTTSTSETFATSIYSTSSFYFDPSDTSVTANIFKGVATSARYADLAERYEADSVYDEGTVVILGGIKEVTVTSTFADTRVAGIVSKNPAYMMNSGAGNDETHPYIALKGRVPCKVVGFIEKGDLLVTSAHPGYATAAKSVSTGAVIGKALETNSEGFAVIEVLVV
jgi:hypothetical protein